MDETFCISLKPVAKVFSNRKDVTGLHLTTKFLHKNYSY